MKFNKWTVGLAAVGVISLASAARADEKMNSLQTALSNTTISGYVSASFNWALSPGGGQNESSPGGEDISFQGPGKQDGFNLDVVKLSIAKPQDESPWASGYQVDLIFGPDAVGYNPVTSPSGSSSSSVANGESYAIKQAYVALRTPIGNGIDWKIGVFDTIIGYEVFDAGSNPNYTRSVGYFVEPTEHTGILGTYKISDSWSVSAGIANTLSAGINARDLESGADNGLGSAWHKTVMASATFTAPSSWGWAAGSSLYAGMVYGFNTSSGHDGGMSGYQQNYYLGATMNTPWKQLTAGFAFDYVRNNGGGFEEGGTFGFRDTTDGYVLGAYVTYKATDKLSINGRAEYFHQDFREVSDFFGDSEFHSDGYEFTATVEYDMWANVVSRVEARFDHDNDFRGDGDHQDTLGFYANIIYKF